VFWCRIFVPQNKAMSTSPNSEEFYKKLKAQLLDTALWPTEYLYKFIVISDKTKIQQIDAIFDNMGAVIATKESKNGKSGATEPGPGNGNTAAGQITAGEWNDLKNWDFWTDLLDGQEETLQQNLWEFNASKRIEVLVLTSGNIPINNAKVALYKGADLVFEARTDNFGEANVFIDLFEGESATIDGSEYAIFVNDVKQLGPAKCKRIMLILLFLQELFFIEMKGMRM